MTDPLVPDYKDYDISSVPDPVLAMRLTESLTSDRYEVLTAKAAINARIRLLIHTIKMCRAEIAVLNTELTASDDIMDTSPEV